MDDAPENGRERSLEMARENVLTQEEINRSFFEADRRIREVISELEHLHRKGLKIRDVALLIKDVFGKMNQEEMVAAWDIKRAVKSESFQSWP